MLQSVLQIVLQNVLNNLFIFLCNIDFNLNKLVTIKQHIYDLTQKKKILILINISYN